MSVIAKAARALWLHRNGCGGRPVPREVIDAYTDDARRACEGDVRVVIGAMNEPSEAMVEAGTVGWDALDGSPVRPIFDPVKPYQLMIAAALAEDSA